MNKSRYKLDEMQEQKLLKIERNACWLAFWGLAAVLVVQVITIGDNLWNSIAGEWILFMVLSVYIIADCLKNGIWSRCYQPSLKTNAIAALAAGIAGGVIMLAMSYMKNQDIHKAAYAGLSAAGLTFAMTVSLLGVFGVLYKKRVEKLETSMKD